MRKIRAAICDEEELYCSRLAEYLQANQSEMVEACVCSQKKELKKLLLESGVDVVLMTEDFFAPDILSYGGVIFALLGDEMVSEEYRKYPCILKYQKAPEILRGICRLAGERLDDTKMFSVLGKEKRSVAFYSPHQEFSQMYLAMGYAKICAAKERVLYLNLMECAGFEELFEEKYKENIGDFLFYLRRQEKNLRLRFESMLHQFGGVDYLPPVFFGEILREAGKEDYQALLVWLLAETDYRLALMNTQRKYRGRICSMFSVMQEILDEAYATEFFDLMCEDDIPMYIATNVQKLFGASVVLYNGLLKAFAEQIGGDFFILPSSTHEVLFVPASVGMDVDCLKMMVHDVNEAEVSEQEFLSNNVYRYCLDTDRMVIA